jgi:hypothetical protein
MQDSLESFSYILRNFINYYDYRLKDKIVPVLMKKYGGKELHLPQFLTSALDENEWSASHSSHFTSGETTASNHWI